MAFCSKCGAQLEDGAKFCPSCGEPLEQPTTNVDPIGGTTYTETSRAQTSGGENDADSKVLAVLAYFGILVLIPILAAPNSKFARFHANQGLILLIAAVICMVIGAIPFIGWIVAFVGDIFILVLAIIGIINAAKGEMKELPIVGGIQILK